MSGIDINAIETNLKNRLGPSMPDNAIENINSALQVAQILESRGYAFDLKDLCPKSLCDTGWRARFNMNDQEFTAEAPQAAAAICTAAFAALENEEI